MLLLQKINDKMLRFISFGSGSSGNCYYLFTETDGLIIDIGVGLSTLKKQFTDYGLSLSKVCYVLITHDHADHIKSVGSISHEYHLPVYATELVHKGIDRNYCVQRKLDPSMKKKIVAGEPFTIEADGVNFCIITDAGAVTDEMKPFITQADYLVIESNHDVEMLKNGPYPAYLKSRILSQNGHLCNADCAQAIAENMSERLKHVWLCHLSEENNHPELARKTVETILRQYGIIAGKNFQLEILKRNVPMGIFDLV